MVEGLHLSPRYRKEIVALLHKHLPGIEVWAYGSRVNGRSHEGSDLDLVLRDPKLAEIDTSRLADFIEALQDSTIPFLVEVRDWARLPESFHYEIEREHVALVEREESLGTASDGWVSLSLGEVCTKIGSGATPRGGEEVYLKDGPYALIRSQNVYNHRFNHDGLAFINQHQATELNNVEVFADDVLLNITGDSVARACQVAPDVLPARVNQHVAIIRPDPHKLSPHFLRYFLVCPEIQAMLLSWAGSGGTRNALTKGMIESFDVQAPMDVDEQRAIAHILGTLDDKIELNRRMNETLEAMARALLKSWFVDFDPVRAKMAGRDTGLPQHLADLFPDRLVASELGEIPEGWKVGTLEDVASLNPESWSTRNAPEEIIYVDLSNTKWGYIEKVETYPWKAAPSRGRRVLRHGDTIVGTVRPGNGSFSLVGRDGLTGSTGFAVLRPKTPSDAELVWCAATSQDNIDRLAHLADGGAYPAVRPEAVAVTKFPLADFATRGAFSSVAASLLNEVDANKQQSHTLADLRDTLLPRLISGEWRAKQIEPESSISNISPDTTGVQA